MADISITANNVIPSSGASIGSATAGTAITAGQPIYIDSNSLAQLSDANGSGTTQVDGIALQSVGSGQRVQYAKTDPSLNIGATLNSGDRVYLSVNAGKLTATSADVTTGSTVILVGVALGSTGGTTNLINLNPIKGGVL